MSARVRYWKLSHKRSLWVAALVVRRIEPSAAEVLLSLLRYPSLCRVVAAATHSEAGSRFRRSPNDYLMKYDLQPTFTRGQLEIPMPYLWTTKASGERCRLSSWTR